MDEGTANIDAKTEREIFDELSKLSITKIVIAHPSGVLEFAETISSLQDGKLNEIATNSNVNHMSQIASTT